ncbi:hypothetical protein [Aerosakkonema sp. BLCC-F183]
MVRRKNNNPNYLQLVKSNIPLVSPPEVRHSLDRHSGIFTAKRYHKVS